MQMAGCSKWLGTQRISTPLACKCSANSRQVEGSASDLCCMAKKPTPPMAAMQASQPALALLMIFSRNLGVAENLTPVFCQSGISLGEKLHSQWQHYRNPRD